METILLLLLGVAVIFIIVQSTKKKESPPRDLCTEANSQNSKPPEKHTTSRKFIELKEYDVFDTFELTGVHIPDRKGFIINFCKEKDLVTVKPEPTNPVNPEALAVYHGNFCIGYIADHDLDEVGTLISNDHKAGIHSIDFSASFLDVQIAIVYKEKK